MTFVNSEYNSHCDNFKQNIIEFNNKLSKYTSNYTLLVIIQYLTEQTTSHIFTYIDNIHFLQLYTVSKSNGTEFENNDENNYLDNIIRLNYKFNHITPTENKNETKT
jgi:hypothetical protein